MRSFIKTVTMIALLVTFATINAADTVIDFAEGKWDKSQWQTIKCFPVKPVDKLKDFAFSQKQGCRRISERRAPVYAAIENIG